MDAVYSFAMRLTRHREDANDLTQETFVRAFERFSSFTSGTNCKAWLFSITYSLFVNQYHRRRREARVVHVDDERELTLRPRLPISPANTAVEVDVEAAVARLGEEFRAAIMLVDIEELSYEEAADVLGCPVGTVRSRLFRARKQLAEDLRAYGPSGRERP
jgi:RNA polymerase sigma-70 factor (ECF subfamily)